MDPKDGIPSQSVRELFEGLFLRYERRMYSLAYYLVHNREQARDLVQETMLKAWQHFKSLQNQASFFTWMKTIMINMVKDRWKGKKEDTVLSLSGEVPEHVMESVADPVTPVDKLQQKEFAVLIRHIMNSLPEQYRVFLHLAHLQGLSHKDIARMLNLPVGTVRVNVHRARVMLKQKLTFYLEKE